jgi:hypothetical protein
MQKYLLSIAVYLLFIFALFTACEEKKQIERKEDAYYRHKIDSLQHEINVLKEQHRILFRNLPDK